MKDDETKYSIEEVIDFCKTCTIVFVDRDKTRQFKDLAGKKEEDLKEEIKLLKKENAFADPELDNGKGRKGYVYQFKKLAFERYWCYIKIKIKIEENRIVVVLSFHEEDLNYENKRIIS